MDVNYKGRDLYVNYDVFYTLKDVNYTTKDVNYTSKYINYTSKYGNYTTKDLNYTFFNAGWARGDLLGLDWLLVPYLI